jgi:hypothetical protein
MKTMKEAGITRKYIIDHIITEIQERFNLTKTLATCFRSLTQTAINPHKLTK